MVITLRRRLQEQTLIVLTTSVLCLGVSWPRSAHCQAASPRQDASAQDTVPAVDSATVSDAAVSDSAASDVPADSSTAPDTMSESDAPSPPPVELRSLWRDQPLQPLAPVPQPLELGEQNPCRPRAAVHDITDLDLDQLLHGEIATSYSRNAERVDDAPASVTVITRDQIRIWGYRSVAEMLEDIAGFYVTDDQIIPNVAVGGITGGPRAESGGLKVMIDGRPVAFRPTGGNWLGPELVPLSAVERVEIVRGPASTVYGADAFLGVINVITRSAEDLCGAEMRLSGSYAGGPGGGLDTTVGGRTGRISAMVSLRLDRLDQSGLGLPASSPDAQLRSGVLPTQPSSGLMSDSGTAFARVTLHIDADNRVSLTGMLSGINRGGDFSSWSQLATGLDAMGRQRGTLVSLYHGYLNLSGEFQPSRTLQITANAGLFGGEPTPSDRIDINSDVFYVRRVMGFASMLADATATWTPLQRLRIVGGADYLLDHETLPGALRVLYSDYGAFQAGDVLQAASTLQGTHDFQNLGVFLLGAWTPLGEQNRTAVLRTDAGVRYDYNDTYGNQINGRLGASLRLFDRLTIKANFASAFRAPSPLLLYGVPLGVGDILGNSTLRPEQIFTWEGSVLVRPWSWLRIQSSLSYSYVRDEAEFVLVGDNSVAQNLAEIGVWAWATDVRINWRDQLAVYANFTLVQGNRNFDQPGYVSSLIGTGLETYPPEVVNAGIRLLVSR